MILSPLKMNYGDNRLNIASSGKGMTGVSMEGDVAFSLLNPASLSVNKYGAYFSYSTKLDNSWDYKVVDDLFIKNKLSKFTEPFFVGLSYNFLEKVNIGIAYARKASYKGNAIDWPGTAKVDIETIYLPVSYEINKLKIGVGVNYNFIDTSENIPESYYSKSDFNMMDFTFGAIYNLNKNITLGLTYKHSSYKSYSLSEDIIEYGEWGEPSVEHYDSDFYIKTPNEVKLGLKYAFTKIPLICLVEYHYENTSVIFDELDIAEEFGLKMKDRHNVHLGTEWNANNNLTLRTGFFTLFNTMDKYMDLDINDQYFLSVGGTYRHDNYHFDFYLLDSSLLSANALYPDVITQFGVGIGMEF